MYKCNHCEKEFKTQDALNCHQKVHKVGYQDHKKSAAENSRAAIKYLVSARIDEYLKNPTKCAQCNITLQYKDRRKKFCNHSCAAQYSNSHRIIDEDAKKRTAEKTSQTLQLYNKTLTTEKKQERIEKVKNAWKTRAASGIVKHSVYNKRVCKICGKVIKNQANKYGYCGDCWFQSDECIKTRAHYNKKYKKEYVYNKWTDTWEYLMSSLEKLYYDYLTLNNIEWRRPNPIKYFRDAKEHRYFPDFYLCKDDLYIEVKGYMWDDDQIKMNLVIEQNPNIKIQILNKVDIKNLLPCGVIGNT